jgi:hypothetical protein
MMDYEQLCRIRSELGGKKQVQQIKGNVIGELR